MPDVLPNLRDLGGLRTESGGVTRPGVLLRSAAPLAGDRRPDLPEWPPATVLDLRAPDELAGRPHPLASAETTVYARPLMRDRVQRDRRIDVSTIPDLPTLYRDILAEAAERVVADLELVADAPGPVLVQCAAGKDRTGVLVAVLLRAAGVTREEVLRDYQRTEPAIPAVLARAPEVAGLADPTHLERLMGVPPEAMIAVLDELDSEPGGAADWLRRRGAAAATVTAWRDRLVA